MNACLVVGSPKGRVSSSWRLGCGLAAALRARGASVGEALVHEALRTDDGTARLLESVERADLVILAFPLYIDSLPAPLIRVLELIARGRSPGSTASSPRLAAIVQCGFPEAHQCETAVGICRLFAERTGFRWAGALAMGMGGVVVEDFRKMPGGGKNVLRAFAMAADSLAAGGDIPEAAAALFARPLMPRWLYNLGGNLGWRMLMRKNKARRPLTYRPYPQE